MAEKQRIRDITEILHLWVKTFGLMKIFSADHANVKKFTSQLFRKLEAHLEQYSLLEIGIQEFSFLVEGEPVYTDNQSGSLPFFFYKDGMASLFFHKNLTLPEFNAFLEIINRESNLPPEESDIVSAFWEKDFANIRYFAPDEYLESHIGLDVEVKQYEIDRDALFSGRIELLPEDKQALIESRNPFNLLGEPSPQTMPNQTDAAVEEPDLEADSILSEDEKKRLSQQIQRNRSVSPDRELTFLILELLYLEEDLARFERTLEVLQECLQQMLTNRDFSQADIILTSVDEMTQNLDADAHDKRALLARFRRKLTESIGSIDIGKDIPKEKDPNFYPGLLQFLLHVGPESLTLVIRILLDTEETSVRKQARQVLHSLGSLQPGRLLDMAPKNQPELTLEILKIAQGHQDTGMASKLADLLKRPHQGIRLAAIQALGKMGNSRAAKFLAPCLRDRDIEVRIAAVKNLQKIRDETAHTHILGVVRNKDFHQKNPEEKKAFLECLADSPGADASELMVSLIRKVKRLSKSRIKETALLAIASLAASKSEGVPSLLEQACRTSHPQLKAACRKARGTA